MSVKRVLGRKDEYIVGLNGARLPSINFYTLFRDYTKISAFQLVQYSTLEVLALIRSSEPLSAEEKARLQQALVLHIGEGVPIYIEEREKFFTNSDGKVLIISRQMGSYKLSSYESYSLPAQHAWADQRQGVASYKLDWNEADEAPDRELLAVMRELFSSDHYLKWYPEARHAGLLKRLAAHVAVESDGHILLTHGSDNGLRLILQAFTDKSVCMVIMPTYDNFRAQAQGFGNRIVGHPMHDGSAASLDGLLKEMERQEPRLLYVTNPNNPIGYQINNAGLARLLSSASRFHGLVVVDEAYWEFSGETALPLLRDHDNLVIVRTFSKAFGLAGMRLGYVLARPALIAALERIDNVKDVTMLSATAAEYLLDHYAKVQSFVAAVNANKEAFYAYCRDRGIRYFPSAGNFVSYEVDSAERYLSFMAERRVFLRDRSAYFDGEFVRATIGGGEGFTKFLAADSAYRTAIAANAAQKPS